MNVLLLGSGGREHALAWKLSQSPLMERLFIAPGNGGTGACGENLDIDILNFELLKEIVIQNRIGLVIPGPEEPIVKGLYDFFKADRQLASVAVLCPSRLAANLEGSKDFAKKFMAKYNIPTARYSTFTKETVAEGINFLRTLRSPYVLKADGLAAGKGVIIQYSLTAAETTLKEMLIDEKFGAAGSKVLIEEFLLGTELSVFVLTDGSAYCLLPQAKDYKRVGENDTGLNTGGMGAVSPVPFAGARFMQKVEEKIIKPTLMGLRQEKMEYSGFIFLGLMNCQGEPKVIEYNVRLGDPETEVILPRIKSDILPLLAAAANGKLTETVIETDERQAITVMMVSGGYPGKYVKGKVIRGLDKTTNSVVFHAGTRLEKGQVVTNGGRVLAVTSLGKDLNLAIDASYTCLHGIDFEGKYFRTDIGKDLQ